MGFSYYVMWLRKIIYVLMILSSTLVVNAQSLDHNVLHGRVLDSQGKAVLGAVVSCFAPTDSTVIGYCVVNEDGAFQMSVAKKTIENICVEVSCLGFEKSYVKPSSDSILVVLKESSTRLHEVAIIASAPRLQQKPGKYIYIPNPSEIEGIDSYELLRYTPLVSIDNNTVSILGKGTSSVYINGRKPVMDRASIMDMLRSIPADKIEKIEIITSPNSSHKASTKGGILNVVMKKNPYEGLTGSASVGATYLGDRLSPRSSLYLGYSKNKFNASANMSYLYYNTQNEKESTYNYKYSNTDIFNSANSQNTGHFLNGNISLSYDITKRSTMGASFHIGGSKSNSRSTTASFNYHNGSLGKYSMSCAETQNPFKRPEVSAVAYYNLKTDEKGSYLDVSANYSSSLNASLGSMEYASGADAESLIPYSLFQQNTTVDSYGYEWKGSYNHAFADGSSLESGYEFDASHLSNDYVRKDHDGDQYVRNEGSSNIFEYDEKVNALYLSYDKAWNDVINTTLGVRAEQTKISGNQVSSNERFTRNYWRFFPQISVLVDLADGLHSLSLDVSRSIVRPFYNDLNPFKIWTSENTYSMGNIHLKPMIYSDVDFSYTFLDDYILGASYSYGSDAFGEYCFHADGNNTVSSVANFGNEQSLSLYGNVEKMLFEGRWRMSLNVEADYERIEGSIDVTDVGYTDWLWTAGIRNVFKVSSKRGIRATLSYNYYSPSRGILKVGHHKHLLGLSMNKNFKFGGSISINAMNLMNYRPAYHYNSASYSYKDNPKTNNISFEIRFTQKFGKSRVRGADNRSETNHLGRFKRQ